ncbi:hypothetical protein VM57_09495 [Stenotrophomonas maltophilia]|uniref:Uncharacterized protein n=1 Tax=Stenotrophomonas maltophilia TaxID=40324 RepID=A0A0F5ZQU2_STEMA|nr:hypothetical protein VM57_09495 [Stenotrophomonas maltophilia]
MLPIYVDRAQFLFAAAGDQQGVGVAGQEGLQRRLPSRVFDADQVGHRGRGDAMLVKQATEVGDRLPQLLSPCWARSSVDWPPGVHPAPIRCLFGRRGGPAGTVARLLQRRRHRSQLLGRKRGVLIVDRQREELRQRGFKNLLGIAEIRQASGLGHRGRRSGHHALSSEAFSPWLRSRSDRCAAVLACLA